MHWLVACLMLLNVSCRDFIPPTIAICITDGDKFVCFDERLPEEAQEYDLPNTTKDLICTMPSDFDAIQSYCTDIRERLLKCLKGN